MLVGLGCSQRLHHQVDKVKFVLIDRVIHIRVQTGSHIATEFFQHFGAVVNKFFRDVEIEITAAQKYGCSIQRARINARRVCRTDQCPTESGDAAITAGVAGSEFERQAGAL